MASSSYTTKQDRIASLEIWPKRNIFDTDELASSGLYYLGPGDDVSDRLRCAYCEFIVADLIRGDDLWTDHASSVPLCWRMLTYKGREFVQSVLEREGVNGQELIHRQDFPKFPGGRMDAHRLHPRDLTVAGITTHLIKKEQSSSRGVESGLLITERGVPLTQPKHHNMIDPEKRLATFHKMDITIRGVPYTYPDFVAAGFFYAGPGDAMTCYHCGVGLQQWTSRDVPWEEHARHAPDCMHVILTKGEEFVEKVIAERGGEVRRPTLQNTCNRKRTLEPEQSGETVDNKRFRVVGVRDREGTDRNRAENKTVFPSTDKTVQIATCNTCRTNEDIVTGTVLLCDRTWTCQSCSRRS